MVRPSHRSRTLRRVKVKTPGGNTKVSYRKRKPSKAICAICKAPLHGVPRERPYQINKLTKSKKRPERTYGGVLCSKCSKQKIIDKTRGNK